MKKLAINPSNKRYYSDEYIKGWEDGVKAQYEATIDAVEVVRCKDCKYGEERIEDYRCGMLDEDWDIRFSPMHFCSYGRRREDGEA